MATTKRLVQTLQHLPLFAECNDRELRRIADLVDERSLPAGTTLMVEGDLAREALVLVTGRAEARVDGTHLADLGPGEVIGEMAMVDRRRARTATVVLTEDADVLVIGPHAFITLMSSYPSVSQKIALALADRSESIAS